MNKYTDEWWQGVKDFNNSFPINIFKRDKVICKKCNDTGGVCEWHPDKEAHKCCGGAGMPCECTKEAK